MSFLCSSSHSTFPPSLFLASTFHKSLFTCSCLVCSTSTPAVSECGGMLSQCVSSSHLRAWHVVGGHLDMKLCTFSLKTNKQTCWALARVAGWLEHCPMHRRISGLTPSQGSYPGCKCDPPVTVHTEGNWSMFLSPSPYSLSKKQTQIECWKLYLDFKV